MSAKIWLSGFVLIVACASYQAFASYVREPNLEVTLTTTSTLFKIGVNIPITEEITNHSTIAVRFTLGLQCLDDPTRQGIAVYRNGGKTAPAVDSGEFSEPLCGGQAVTLAPSEGRKFSEPNINGYYDMTETGQYFVRAKVITVDARGRRREFVSNVIKMMLTK